MQRHRMPLSDRRAGPATRPAPDVHRQYEPLRYGIHRVDRGGGRHHDRRFGRRPHPHDPNGRCTRRPSRIARPPRPRLPSGGPQRRRTRTRRAHRRKCRSDKTRGTATLRRPVRTHQRRRHHGSAARSGSFRLRTRLSDRFDRRHPPLPDGTGSRTHRPTNNTTPKISCQCRISPDRRSLWDQAPIRLHEPVRSRRNRPTPLQTNTDNPIA